MKTRHPISIILSVFMIFSCNILFGQNLQDTIKADAPNYLIIKNDKSQFVGIILYQDAREVSIKTEKLGEIIIPKHEIKEIRELSPGDYDKGIYQGEELFATRYFLTTNGLAVKKGESYN